ncbi:MAG: CRISPR-associated endonuclease Cas3'' [Candidatus Accumulibacter cognatus]|uniref:CRISPR-associated endonuclease Cas3 n=1 Tax=Candidatus Accumulibacter cognatus TaxID=2954383 RepID=A0A7D5SHA7_9PROT|nr:MAG: CRISPR-associated endonuclease Cas3'' [Candidatus Accumulibacter cognatus]
MTYWAHSENDYLERHRLAMHLNSVARIAGVHASDAAWRQEAELAGKLHDLGKYGDLFQKRLAGTESGLDHWSTGAYAALMHFRSVASALAIEGHHIGLQCASPDALSSRMRTVGSGASPMGQHIRLSDQDITRLLARANADGIDPSIPEHVALPIRPNAMRYAIASMLDVRMLFSCLVDADYLDTEAHFQGSPEGKRYRDAGLSLDAEEAVRSLDRFMAQEVRGRRQSSDAVAAVRADLWKAVTEASAGGSGVYSLTAPTGSGKTFAMLQFALAHARQNQFKRVVLAVPYLSIIEQTAREYRKVFAEKPADFILEHHSLAGIREANSEVHKLDEAERQRRLHAENWDAPIVITTNVQLLESLFANRPSTCRKLHKLRDAVILFDEVQTLPQHLAVPTLAALSHLSRAYHTSVVFATATQPAFDTLDKDVQRHAVSGWQPREIVPMHHRMFQQLERVQAVWPAPDEALSWDDLSTILSDEAALQSLCVLNLKRHAHTLLEAMQGTEGLCHLSTNLCTAHRRAVLDEVRVRLNPAHPQPCRLISTQCVEAGVDLDFPLVYRAMAPLEAIAQAAGRCNREGRMNANGQLGRVRVFEPALDTSERRRMYPSFAYFQASQVTLSLLRESGGVLDINDPAVFRCYYQALYGISRPVEQNRDLTKAIDEFDFPEIAQRYRLIDQEAIQIVVPWQRCLAQFEQLRDQAASGINGEWMRNAQALSVSIYRPRSDHPAWGCLIPAQFRRGGASDEWFVLEDPDGQYYDEILGLQLPQNQIVMIA